ncbi:hypothetical protein [Devosia sp.]|uniref:hypothetical protein n=1 Tax=Devosia sp. TaxID=1871048 RepID=UPI003265CC6B
MEVWVGPAIIAALVSATISALGWIVTFRATLEALASNAVAALDKSLNSRDAGQSIPKSASEAALAERSASP